LFYKFNGFNSLLSTVVFAEEANQMLNGLKVTGTKLDGAEPTTFSFCPAIQRKQCSR